MKVFELQNFCTNLEIVSIVARYPVFFIGFMHDTLIASIAKDCAMLLHRSLKSRSCVMLWAVPEN